MTDIYSQTCIKRSPLEERKCDFIRRDLLREVQFI